MEGLYYSDIHHDDYTNGITEDDVVAVENEITQFAINNHVKHTFFLGDWYRATNPNRSVIARAEACWKWRSDIGVHTTVVVGNHDRWTKSVVSGHAFVSAGIFNNDLKNIKVIDTVNSISFEDTTILCIPAGHENAPILKNWIKDSKSLVVLFHGLVAGSALANGASAAGGIHPDILRSLRADMIIGGDNHTHQRLDALLGCPSMYLGAPLQHNWGDRGQRRGFWHVDYDGKSQPKFTFIPTNSPRFVRTKVPARNETDAILKIAEVIQKELEGRPGILEITLLGQHVGNINIDFVEQSVLKMGMRKVRVIADRTYDKIELVSGVSEARTPEDKWNAYIFNLDQTKTKDMNPTLLSEMGKWALQEARRNL